MTEPTIQGMSVGCPYCPTRATCACPDGPERCPDNGDCPCDKTVCPCAKHAKRPPPHEPPGCRDRSLLLGVGLLAGVIAIVVVLILLLRDDGDGDSVATQNSGATTQVTTDSVTATDPLPPPDTPPVEDTTAPTDPAPPPDTQPPPETDAPAPTTTAAPAPGFVPPAVDPDDVDAINTALFGGLPTFAPGNCHVVTPAMRQTDQTGGTPLVDPSLDITVLCSVNSTVVVPPMLDGDFFVVGVGHLAPWDTTNDVSHQPGIGLNWPDGASAPPEDSGEGLVQVPADVLGFGQGLDGWQPAQFFEVPGFGPSEVFGYTFGLEGSPFSGFAIPIDQLPPGTTTYWQSFGRQTAAGNAPGAADPAASVLAIGGVVPPCFGDCTPPPGRFTVEVGGGDDGLTAVEGSAGTFWFGDAENAELLLKVLDACDVPESNSFWVFAGALTNVEYTLTVTDTQTGESRVYDNPLGRSFEPIVDTAAFATCP